MKKLLLKLTIVSSVFLFAFSQVTFSNGTNDTVFAYKAPSAPVFDGIGDDTCWQQSPWFYIDQTWITWGESIDSADFYGRFKVSWSEDNNLLYFLVEVTDDVFVDGYSFPNSGYPNYDCTELFIDEDNSGGDHEHNENAFAYHMMSDAPALDTTSNLVAVDLAVGWDPVDYTQHFEKFMMRQNGDIYTREFALKAYSDLYVDGNPEASRVTLTMDKHLGFSLAYCDNDTPGTDRDNFFGSVYVPEANYNDHWQNADFFGKLILKGDAPAVDPEPDAINNTSAPLFKTYPNPTSSGINIILPGQGLQTEIALNDLLGNIILQKQTYNNNIYLNLANYPAGIYFLQVKNKAGTFVDKIILK